MATESMRNFEPHVRFIEELACNVSAGESVRDMKRCVAGALNGEVASQMRAVVPVNRRRETGVFFTSEQLARRVASKLLSKMSGDSVIADPACGAGDLLIACAQKLPLGNNLTQTLRQWGGRLMGFDIHAEFVRATKARLVLLAMSRLGFRGLRKITELENVFPLIEQKDFLDCRKEIRKASHIVMNPPYNEMPALSGCKWGNNSISAAAVFVELCVTCAAAGTRIGVILPDVLRSGSSYEKWRVRVDALCCRGRTRTLGQFDDWTDVDVFSAQLVVGEAEKKRKIVWRRLPRGETGEKVGDHFEVRVGPVVPHRDAEEGPRRAYIHSRMLPAWKRVKRINESRQYAGTTFAPPFVAVRRTSRPGKGRAIGTLVTGKRRVAVENHLIVLVPKRKTIKECKELIRVLKLSDSDRWLNNRIRCRHLTVESIKELPWWSLAK